MYLNVHSLISHTNCYKWPGKSYKPKFSIPFQDIPLQKSCKNDLVIPIQDSLRATDANSGSSENDHHEFGLSASRYRGNGVVYLCEKQYLFHSHATINCFSETNQPWISAPTNTPSKLGKAIGLFQRYAYMRQGLGKKEILNRSIDLSPV